MLFKEVEVRAIRLMVSNAAILPVAEVFDNYCDSFLCQVINVNFRLLIGLKLVEAKLALVDLSHDYILLPMHNESQVFLLLDFVEIFQTLGDLDVIGDLKVQLDMLCL